MKVFRTAEGRKRVYCFERILTFVASIYIMLSLISTKMIIIVAVILFKPFGKRRTTYLHRVKYVMYCITLDCVL